MNHLDLGERIYGVYALLVCCVIALVGFMLSHKENQQLRAKIDTQLVILGALGIRPEIDVDDVQLRAYVDKLSAAKVHSLYQEGYIPSVEARCSSVSEEGHQAECSNVCQAKSDLSNSAIDRTVQVNIKHGDRSVTFLNSSKQGVYCSSSEFDLALAEFIRVALQAD